TQGWRCEWADPRGGRSPNGHPADQGRRRQYAPDEWAATPHTHLPNNRRPKEFVSPGHVSADPSWIVSRDLVKRNDGACYGTFRRCWSTRTVVRANPSSRILASRLSSISGS